MEQIAWYLILNPMAGGGKAEKKYPQIAQLLTKKGISFTTFKTSAAGDGEKVVKTALKAGYRKILVCGGDGTLNEIVNGVMNQDLAPTQEITIGLIPVGTGNDWGRTWNLSRNIKTSIAILQNGKTAIQDVGLVKFNYKPDSKIWFMNVAGCGFDAAVAYAANKEKEKGNSSVLTYIKQLVKTLFTYKTATCEMMIDGKKISSQLFAVLIGIGKFAGNKMKLVPNAIPNDGQFDITLAHKISPWKVIRNFPKLFNGKFLGLKEVSVYQGTEFSITSEEDMYFQADGESMGKVPLRITLVPNAIKVIIG
jgi:YegS/Rv2252/BmrU family lipid kinase